MSPSFLSEAFLQEFESYFKYSKLKDQVEQKRRYYVQAYNFVMQALDFVMDQVKKEEEKSRHVSGEELVWGIRDYALQEYGPMAGFVLRHWGLSTTRDFGEIVFDLVDLEILAVQENDRIEDFEGVFHFEEIFERNDSLYLDIDLDLFTNQKSLKKMLYA